jgi:predicted  nucleic acid-binding Zn-ribbon protein
VSKIQKGLEDQLAKMLVDRDSLLAEMRSVRSAVKKDNPKKNKWLTEMIDHLDKLDTYITQNENRIQAIKQRKHVAKSKLNSKQDSKRKILMGAMVERLMNEDKISRSFIVEELDKFLTRDSDKALFADYFSDDHQDSDSALS